MRTHSAISARLDPVGRLRALTAAYRGWAAANSHRYRLLYLEPIPGYDAHADELVAAARAVMAVTVEVIDGLNLSLTAVPGAGWVAESDWARNVPPGTSLELDLGFRGVMFWARIHGLIDLELNGNYASMRLDPDVLYEYEMAQLVSGH